ncbi:type IV pilus biogenesis/stability protein PilW [Billgrantia gudaonensis]|uniref:Type IV pilus assembly protein PilF n=1 Tax=Billgrantia gudaonensis TaxID=376427 RepID=A0A1G9A7T5_9GAMM|nr:type IV pilus biogenesis/stability protein PilW [Halomonas gudaonensis]SDK23311.1 type IV pilus assembly protein PilF [Halomonas gudaonensis]
MTRHPWLLPRRSPLSLAAVLAGSLWLGGCAGMTERTDDAGGGAAEAYTRLGVAYLERNNLPRAMSALDRALEHDPSSPEALQAMAVAYQRQGEDDLAEEAFRRALSSDPDFTQARNNYAAFLYDLGRTEEACEQLEHATRDTQYARRAQLFANLGRCRRDQGEIDAARTSLERAVSLDPRYASAYLRLADLALAEGELAQAQRQLERYMSLAGETAEARALANEIATARSGDAALRSDPDAP